MFFLVDLTSMPGILQRLADKYRGKASRFLLPVYHPLTPSILALNGLMGVKLVVINSVLLILAVTVMPVVFCHRRKLIVR